MTAVDTTAKLASYMAQARDRPLPPDVARDAKHRILDTIAAMVSGSHLPPGEMAIRFARAQGGVAEATVLTTDIRTSAINAALANGMFAHADETDDFEPVTKAHPGSHIVPASLAMAKREGRSGLICSPRSCLATMSAAAFCWRSDRTSSVAVIGAPRVPATMARRRRYALRAVVRGAVSGLWSWVRDPEHVEEAFDFSGMGARNGVTAAIMAQLGPLTCDGEHNHRASSDPKPRDDRGSQSLFRHRNRHQAPSLIQAPLDAFPALSRTRFVDNVERRSSSGFRRMAPGSSTTAAMPEHQFPDIIALALVKGNVSFEDSTLV